MERRVVKYMKNPFYAKKLNMKGIATTIIFWSMVIVYMILITKKPCALITLVLCLLVVVMNLLESTQRFNEILLVFSLIFIAVSIASGYNLAIALWILTGLTLLFIQSQR